MGCGDNFIPEEGVGVAAAAVVVLLLLASVAASVVVVACTGIVIVIAVVVDATINAIAMMEIVVAFPFSFCKCLIYGSNCKSTSDI